MIKIVKEIAFHLRVKAGYITAFALLLISYLITLYGNSQLMKQSGWVIHTNKVIKNLDGLVSGMTDAETGVRGYTNTGDTNFLLPYRNSFGIVDTTFAALKTDMKGNDMQGENLAALNTLIRLRYDRLSFAVDHYPQAGYRIDDTLLRSFYWGKAIMDRIRSIVSAMQKDEQNLLSYRKKELNARYTTLNIIVITSFIIAMILALFGFYTYWKEYKARLISDKKAADYKKESQQRIVELDTVNRELIIMKRSEKFAATGRIARTIAHEVRNPLTNIDLAIAQIKSDMPAQDENSTMFFDMVSRNSKRINQLVSELLSATRFAELNYVSVSVNTLLDEALDMAKDRIDLNHITVEKKFSRDIYYISVDQEKVKIAFLNLIVNAIEAMEPGEGILQVHTWEEGGKCIIEITDNGQGMTDEELNNLFEPYFTTKTNGNGLGLTNTQNIILNHKGCICVTSKPGKGTSFTIKFDSVPAVSVHEPGLLKAV